MSIVLQPLVNRAKSGAFEMPTDGWFLISPKGEFPHDSGVTQVIDDEAVRQMANSFSPGSELLIDFEHESHDPQKRTTAAGWIQNLAARSDGLYAQVHWSKSGVEAIQGGEYRYISPVWNRSDCQDLGGNKLRPKRLADAGLTNRPNLRGIAALSNREANASSASEVILSSRTPAEIFANAVKDIKSSRSCSFEQAWELAQESQPILFFNALREQPLIGNRAEQIVPSHTWPGGQNPYLRFDSLVKAHAVKNKVGYDQAFDAVKLTHLNEYAQMCAEHERDQAVAEKSRPQL